jgi:tetratricopeptide (TPR) repeat protein
MRTILAALLFPALLWGASLKDARLRWLKGNYEEAAEQYAELLKDDKNRAEASIGLSRALASQGEYDKALTAIDDALKALPKNSNLLARRAELLHLRGRWEESGKAVEASLAANDKNLLARWVRTQLLRDQGEIKKAKEEAVAIFRIYNASVDTPSEVKDPDSLLLIALASAENARWSGLADEFQTILEVLGDALKAEKEFWPAELHSGLLLLEKYNRAEAADAFQKALKINPSAAEALVARGAADLQRFEYGRAEDFAEQALKINPRLPEALRLRADVHLGTGNFAAVEKVIAQALAVNPKDEQSLARKAAAAILRQDEKGFAQVVAEVNKVTRASGVFYFEVARSVEDRKRYDLAEKYYREAMKLRPELAGPINSLGMLLLRLGQEKEGKELLDKGFKLDQFNVRVSNMRKVMDHLAGYKELKTKHFIIRYDEKSDPVLAKYMAHRLEEIYDELAARFDYRPEGPFLIEVFRSHDKFSGRTVALPDLHTIGACIGRVVTMVSPNEKDSRGERARAPFNWMRVLRHEVVHIFNLAQTNYLVPHWFTEGLAVANEGLARPPSWNLLLARQVAAGQLLNLDTIDLAFIRPRNATQWQQAYLQANLYIEYIEKEYGKQAIGKLLAAFAKGASAPAAIKEVCKADKEDFEKGYRKFLQGVVEAAGLKKAAEKKRTLEELRAANKKDPEDVEAAAELAYRTVETQRANARKLAEMVLKKDKDNARALYVLAKLAERAADEGQQRKYLEQALNRDDPFPPVLKDLGKLYYEANDLARAVEVFELGRKAEPAEVSWLTDLQRAYAKQDNKAKLTGVLKELVPLDADNLDWRLRLARLLMDAGKAEEAEQYARSALEIDVTSVTARSLLYQALKAQKKADELAKLEAILGEDTGPKGGKGKD